jgi:hypothetical protein
MSPKSPLPEVGDLVELTGAYGADIREGHAERYIQMLQCIKFHQKNFDDAI